MVQIWSRYARNFEATKPSSSTEWLRELWEHLHHKYQRREHLPDSISGLVLSSPGTRPLCLALCCRNWRLEAPKMVHSVDSGLGPKHWERTRAATSKKLWLARRGNIYILRYTGVWRKSQGQDLASTVLFVQLGPKRRKLGPKRRTWRLKAPKICDTMFLLSNVKKSTSPHNRQLNI